MTVIKNNGEVIYGKGELINNGTLLYNNDGIYSISNLYKTNAINSNNEDSNSSINDNDEELSGSNSKSGFKLDNQKNSQIFSNEHTFRYYFGNFYISKDAFVTIGTSNMKFKLTECHNTIFTGFLFDDLYSFQLLKQDQQNEQNNISGVNEKCSLTSLSNNIIFTTKIENRWNEGDTIYSQITTTILNNNTLPITSLSFKTNLILRDENSFWNVLILSNNNNNNNSNNNNQFTLPSYAYKNFNPGNTYSFGFITKSNIKNNIIPIFTII